MPAAVIYPLAALAEIAGWFAVFRCTTLENSARCMDVRFGEAAMRQRTRTRAAGLGRPFHPV
jgi:drug/metabolite transporter superfamily protein YnfA